MYKRQDKVTSPGYVSAPEGTQVRGGHFLYRYNGTSWSQVEDSCFSDYQKNSSGPDYSIQMCIRDSPCSYAATSFFQFASL